MAQDVRNIIVGAASVYVTSESGDARASIPAMVTSTSYATTVGNASNWREVGLTTGGVELSYEPNYGEVTVDQLLDAARLFKQAQKVTVKTTLTEGTLENMNMVFGQGADKLVANNTSKVTLSLSGGALGEAPAERTLVFVGQSPYKFSDGTTTTNWDTTHTKERVYVARRVIQMETVAHALKRDGATEFPVSFRCLQDTTRIAQGDDYGYIIDRVYSA